MKATALGAPDSNTDIFCSSPHLLLYNTDNKKKAETLALTLSFQFSSSLQMVLYFSLIPGISRNLMHFNTAFL